MRKLWKKIWEEHPSNESCPCEELSSIGDMILTFIFLGGGCGAVLYLMYNSI